MADININACEDPRILRDVADLLNKWADMNLDLTSEFVAGCNTAMEEVERGEATPRARETAEPIGTPEDQDREASEQDQASPLTVDLDSAGYPWDERIHAGTKTKNKDGTWKKRKGVEKDLIEQVQAELRAAMTPSGFTVGEVVESEQIAADTEQAAADAQPTSPAQAFGQQMDQQMMQAATAPPTELVWPDVLSKIANAKSAGQVTNDQLTQVLANHNIAALPLLIQRKDVWPNVLGELGLQ